MKIMNNVIWKSEDGEIVVEKKNEKFRVFSLRRLKLSNGAILPIWRLILETDDIDKAIKTAKEVCK